MTELKKISGSCPRCGSPPAVKVRVSDPGPLTSVTLNVLCIDCKRRGVPLPECFYDLEVA